MKVERAQRGLVARETLAVVNAADLRHAVQRLDNGRAQGVEAAHAAAPAECCGVKIVWMEVVCIVCCVGW
ncbi:hypothetical protein D9M68_889270 [compost metagenome]